MTENRTQKKAVVIGAGIAGLCAAIELVNSGWDVLCLERAFPGSGCTWGSIGLVYPTIDEKASSALKQTLLTAYHRYDAFLHKIRSLSGSEPISKKTSLLEVFGPSSDSTQFTRTVENFRQLGISPQKLDAQQISALEPTIRNPQMGLLFPDAIWIYPPSLIETLLAAYSNSGGKIKTESTVNKIEVYEGACHGVWVDDEFIAADITVVCAGAWSRPLIGGRQSISMRGQSFVARGIATNLPVYVEDLDIVPMLNGECLVGATQELGKLERVSTLDGIFKLIESLKRNIRCSDDIELVELRSGIRSSEPDGMPILGPVPDASGLYVLSGLWKNGIGLAPELAQSLVRLINGTEPTSEIAAFSAIDRW